MSGKTPRIISFGSFCSKLSFLITFLIIINIFSLFSEKCLTLNFDFWFCFKLTNTNIKKSSTIISLVRCTLITDESVRERTSEPACARSFWQKKENASWVYFRKKEKIRRKREKMQDKIALLFAQLQLLTFPLQIFLSSFSLPRLGVFGMWKEKKEEEGDGKCEEMWKETLVACVLVENRKWNKLLSQHKFSLFFSLFLSPFVLVLFFSFLTRRDESARRWGVFLAQYGKWASSYECQPEFTASSLLERARPVDAKQRSNVLSTTAATTNIAEFL